MDWLKNLGRRILGGRGGGGPMVTDMYPSPGGAYGPTTNPGYGPSSGTGLQPGSTSGGGDDQGVARRILGWVEENPELAISLAATGADIYGSRQQGKVADRQLRMDEEDRRYQRQQEEDRRRAHEVALGRILARRQNRPVPGV